MRVAGYLRVSTEGQLEHGFGLPEQQARVLEFCQRHGHSLVELISDEAVSGRREVRPGLSRILALAEAKEIDAVVSVRMDRLGRENRIAQDVLRQVRQRGCKFWFTEHGGGERPSERLQENIHGSFAEYEWAVTRERTMSGRSRKAKEERVMPNGRAPYGYFCIRVSQAREVAEFKDRDGEFVVVEDEAKIVRELFERYAAGATLRGLAVMLQERGTLTRNGLPFRRSVVLQLLRNPAYKGTPEYNKREYRSGSHSSYRVRPVEERIQLQCPAIVSESLWETVAERLNENQTAMAGRPSAGYPLRGLVFCGACVTTRGTPTRCVGQSNGNGGRWYGCNSRTPDGGRAGCTCRFRADDLEDLGREALRQAAAGALVEVERERAARALREAGDPQAAIHRAQAELADVAAQEERLLDDALTGDFPAPLVKKKQAELKARREAAEQARRDAKVAALKLVDPDEAAKRAERTAAELRENLEAVLADPEQFAVWARRLLRVTLRKDQPPVIEVRVPPGAGQ